MASLDWMVVGQTAWWYSPEDLAFQHPARWTSLYRTRIVRMARWFSPDDLLEKEEFVQPSLALLKEVTGDDSLRAGDARLMGAGRQEPS